MNIKQNTLKKSERLSSERRLETLFENGRRGGVGPVRFCWVALPASPETGADPTSGPAPAPGVAPQPAPGVSVLFSVPKKTFRRAWTRNLLKRRMRESYRTRKHDLVAAATAAGISVDLALICSPPTPENSGRSGKKQAPGGPKRAPVAAEPPDFKTIDHAIEKILGKIAARIRPDDR